MFSLRFNLLPFVAAVLIVFSLNVFAQKPTPTPPEDKPEVIYTEEIKVNIAAFDENGNFADSLKKEDVVINEDGRLHQANILQHIPVNVLILLDTGGENRQAKSFSKTRETALSLINALQKDDKIAVMDYYDKVDLLTDWTSDKAAAAASLKKMSFGSRSRFADALRQATEFLEKLPVENRHLVLITDGLDSINDAEAKASAFRNLTATNVNVHVFSYTGLEQAVISGRRKSLTRQRLPQQLPPGASDPNARNTAIAVPIGSPINLDRAMAQKIKERSAALAVSEKDLMRLASDTNGIFYLPETTDEMIEKTTHLAKNIDSQYVVIYTPKKPLSESTDGEIRNIEVTSKRDGVFIQSRRKLTVLSKR